MQTADGAAWFLVMKGIICQTHAHTKLRVVSTGLNVWSSLVSHQAWHTATATPCLTTPTAAQLSPGGCKIPVPFKASFWHCKFYSIYMHTWKVGLSHSAAWILKLIFIYWTCSCLVSSLNCANHVRAGCHLSQEGKEAGWFSQQASRSLSLLTHIHIHKHTHIPGISKALSPHLIRPTSLASGQLLWLKWIKDDARLSLSFFSTLSLDFSFLSIPDERPPRHPLHAHTIQARTHRKSMCCMEGWGEGGRELGGKWQREGVEGVLRGGKAREGLNPSHVKLMRTNLQMIGPCFLSPAYCLFYFSNCFLLFLPLIYWQKKKLVQKKNQEFPETGDYAAAKHKIM